VVAALGGTAEAVLADGVVVSEDEGVELDEVGRGPGWRVAVRVVSLDVGVGEGELADVGLEAGHVRVVFEETRVAHLWVLEDGVDLACGRDVLQLDEVEKQVRELVA